MSSGVFVYDAVAHDSLNAVRGIGRYMEILRENFSGIYGFINDVKAVPANATLLNPFVNLIGKPLLTTRVAKYQVGVIHDLIPLKYPRRFPIGLRGKLQVYRNKRLLHLYDRFITDSEASKADIIRILKIDAEKITVAYPCLASHFAHPATAPLPGVLPLRYFIYVGDVTWNKNIAVIAHAVKEANASCVFVGKAFAGVKKVGHGPWLREFRSFAKIVKNDVRYIFPGFVDNEVLKSLYKHAVANILFSRDEGYGFSYAEAASQKTPSIMADIPVFREIAGDTAILVDSDDVQGLTRALVRISDSPQQSEKLGLQAHRQIAHYSSKQFVDSVQIAMKSQ